MSRANSKGGAKRRKNKRGDGRGDHSAVSCVRDRPAAVLEASEAAAIVARGAIMAANTPRSVSECVGGAASAGYLETSFIVGETQRTPSYPSVDNCVLCRTERKDSSFLESGIEAARKLGLSLAPAGSSVPQQPLWVCLHCQWTLEKLRIYSGVDQSEESQDVPVGDPLSESTEEAVGDRLPQGAQLPLTDTLEAYNEPEPGEISIETDRESLQLQDYWAEVRYLVRCIYRQIDTPLGSDREWVKELVDRLCRSDPSQLYQRLDQQARDYLLEMKIGLLRQLSAVLGVSSCLQSPLQAYQLVCLLLKEYSTFCKAARNISNFLVTLENKHLSIFHVTWELHNKHLFENLVFSEPLIQSNLPALVSHIKLGSRMHDTCRREAYRTLLYQYQHFEREMHRVAKEWLECQKRVSVYIKQKMTVKTKLAKDLKHFKQRQFHAEQFSKKVGTGEKFTNPMRHVLSSQLSIPDSRYDSSRSHTLTSGIMDPHTPSCTQIHQPLLQTGSAPDCLSQSHQLIPLASSGSGSSSPVTIQPRSRLIHADNVSTPTVCSDDDVASLSAKFADIHPFSDNNTEEVSNVRSDARGDPAGVFLSSSILALPTCYSPHYESQDYTKDVCDLWKEGRDKSADQDSGSEHEHSSNSSSSSCACACTCTYAGQREGKYCDYCCEFFRQNWPSATPRGRNYEGMREKLRFRLAKRKEEQSKKTDQLSEQESVVDNRTVDDLVQFINSSEIKPVSSTRAAKRARHKQRKQEEKARLEEEAKAREQVLLQEQQRQEEQKRQEEVNKQLAKKFQQLQKQQAVKKKEKPRKDLPAAGNVKAATRHEAHTGPGAHGDSKLVLPKEVHGKQQEPLSFLLDITHHHKEGTGKQKPKQAWKASSEPRRRPEGEPRPQTQAESKAKELDLASTSEQKRKERKVSKSGNKKQLIQVKEGKASAGPSKQAHSSKPVLADTQHRGKSKKNRKKKGDGDGDDSSLEDIFMPKDIDLDDVDMDETEREVEYFKRFCLDSTRQTRQRLSIDWSDFSLKKPRFLPTK